MKFFAVLPTVAASLLLVQCSQNAVPLAGSLSANDPIADSLMQKALQEQRKGDLKDSINFLEKITEDHPLSVHAPKAWFLIGQLQEQRGEPTKAFEAYNQLLKNHFNSPLYSQALECQKRMAFLAADQKLKYKFLGITTTVSRSDAADMLTKVRENGLQSKIAPIATLRLGKLYTEMDKPKEAIDAFHILVDKYPSSPEAPKAQYAIGETLMLASREGNQDKANVRRAREAFEDFLQRYSSHSLAPSARKQISMIKSLESQRTLETALFYHKIGDLKAAQFYCKEVINSPTSSAEHKKAAQKLMNTPIKKDRPLYSIITDLF